MGRIAVIALAAVLILAAPQNTSAQQKAKKNKDEVKLLETTPQDYQALFRFEGIYGRIVSMDPANRRVRVRVEYQLAQPAGRTAKAQPNGQQARQKQGAGKKGQGGKQKAANNRNRNNQQKFNQQKNRNKNKNKNRPNNRNGNRNKAGRNRNGTNAYQLAREYAQIQKIRNPVQRQLRMQQFLAKLNRAQQQQLRQQLEQLRRQAQQAQRQFRNRFPMGTPKGQQPPQVKMVTVAKEFDLYLAPDVRVARKDLPFEYDEKGFVKEYTEEEKKNLKDDVLPGYKAKLEDLVPGQLVYLYFKRLEKGKETRERLSPGISQGAGPRVTGVLIVADAVPEFPDAKPRRGKKKQ